MLAKPRKLRFRVAYCSSEDPEFPASELNAHSPNTQGWLSARMCHYPQEIVVQFDGLVRLSALQILSNKSRIAQKIELYVGTCENALESPSLQSASFRRLGYLSLDSNERSQYRACELKEVNLSTSGKDTRAQFLRLIIHENHINSLNIHGQVGILAVNALGVDMHPFEQDVELEESLGGVSNHQPMVAPNTQLPEVDAWLATIGLPQYAPKIKRYGYDQMAALHQATQADIVEMTEDVDVKMKKPHRRIFVAEWKKLLASTGAPGDDAPGADAPEPEPEPAGDALVVFGARCIEFEESDSDLLGPVSGIFDDETNPSVSIDEALKGKNGGPRRLHCASAPSACCRF